MQSHRFRSLHILAAAGAVSALALAPAAAGRVAQRQRATTANTGHVSVAVSGTRVTVQGRVRLSHATRAERRRAEVLVKLADSSGISERRTAKLDGRDRFRVSWNTQLSGRLTLRLHVVVAGRRVGGPVKRSLIVTQPAPGGGTPLVGTFKLAAGSAPSGQAPTGSYFEMLQSNGSPLANLSSPAPNKDFTPLSPGTDGGLRTDAYQPAPSPAFAGGNFGGALASRIIRPVPFYLINFSIQTASIDAQLGAHDPLPSIEVRDGQLSGQLTAWVAQWNGQSFNQGTPKPNGSVPPPTTPVSGTYDPGTHQFTLQWKSLIVGGPFNGFTGFWHLAGTFVPAGSILPLPLPTL